MYVNVKRILEIQNPKINKFRLQFQISYIFI